MQFLIFTRSLLIFGQSGKGEIIFAKEKNKHYYFNINTTKADNTMKATIFAT